MKRSWVGPSQRKVLEYLKNQASWVFLKTIGEVVGGKNLTGRSLRGSSWACQVLKPLLKDGFVEKFISLGGLTSVRITQKGIKFFK